MTEESQRSSPVAYITGVSSKLVSFALVFSVITVPAIYLSYSRSATAGGFAFVVAMVYSLVILLESSDRDTSNPIADVPRWYKALYILSSLLVYNLIVFVGALLGTTAVVAIEPVAGLLVALLYPVWDAATMKRGLPISVGGMFVATVIALTLIGMMGKTARELFQDIGQTPVSEFDSRVRQFRGRRRRLN